MRSIVIVTRVIITIIVCIIVIIIIEIIIIGKQWQKSRSEME